MANVMDDFRGMSPEQMKSENEKTKVNQGNEQQTQNQQSSQNSNDSEKQTQQSQQSQSQQQDQGNQNQQTQQQNQQDQQGDFDKEIKLLKNTFGFNEDEITEKDLKLARSYMKSQSGYTTKAQELAETKQQAEQFGQTLTGLQNFLDNNPDIAKMIEKRANGENSQQQEPDKGKPNYSNERKLGNISERELIQAGYLSESDLDGLDDLERAEKLVDAKTEYLVDKKTESFEQKLKQKEESLEQQRKQKLIKQENDKRVEDGFERLVADYGVDFEEVPDTVMDKIRKRATSIKDPSDPSGQLIDKDAYYDAGLKELAQAGLLDVDNRFGIRTQQNQGQNQQGLEDTGTNLNSNNQQQGSNKEKTLGELLNEANTKRWQKVTDQGSRFDKFRQKQFQN